MSTRTSTPPPRTTAAADWCALGTGVRLVVTDPALLDSCNLLLARHLAEVDAACSRFRTDSELAALEAALGRPVTVSPLLAEALAVALRAAEATDGAVDPTVGSAMNSIGYDRDFTLVREDDRPVRLTVRCAPGWRAIDLDAATGTVTVPAGVRLDLGATAKAWAADKAAAMLAQVAGCGVLVSLGGDTAVAGSPGRRLEHPRPGRHRLRRRDTRARYVRHGRPALRRPRHLGHRPRRWRRNGYELHHIVDPRTGLPVRSPWRTVSVAAASSTESPQSWWAATTAPGFRPRKRPNAPWTRATWGPESSRHSPSTAAEWPKPPESSATWPCNRPASAAPA